MSYTANYSEHEPARGTIDAMPGLVVLEFGAPWCGYCMQTQPALARLLAHHAEVEHIKIYDGKGKPLGRSFTVKLWPTLVFLKGGEVVARLVRPEDADIERALEALVAPSEAEA